MRISINSSQKGLSSQKGFTIVEVMVVLILIVTVMGVAVYKFRQERVEQMRTESMVDRQQAQRRFLMFFRQDMLALNQITKFHVHNAATPDLDSRVIQVEFDRWINELDREVIEYKYDFNQRKVTRTRKSVDVQEGSFTGENNTMVLENVVNFQLIPHNLSSERIRTVADLPQLYFFESRILFSENRRVETANSLRPLILRIYPRLKSSMAKSGFARFQTQNRF